MVDGASQTAQSAKDSMSQTAQSAKESTLETKDQAGGFLQQVHQLPPFSTPCISFKVGQFQITNHNHFNWFKSIKP